MASTHSRRFRSAKYRLEIGGASGVVFAFSDIRQPFVGKVRAFARMPPCCAGSVRCGPPSELIESVLSLKHLGCGATDLRSINLKFQSLPRPLLNGIFRREQIKMI
jgi:hypothetical protein